jgi:phosphate transport system ATP-binding protein
MTAATQAPAPPSRETGVLRARQYSFWYGPRQALFDITLGVAPNRVTALIGPSGCGKSTFLRSINRLQELLPGTRHTGDILFDGGSVFAPSVDAVELRRRIGMVFQRPNPFPKSVFDNVAYGPRVSGSADVMLVV